ncbi:TlpA family protein disulfide reductase [Aureivirga sp. CE67]|uniref:TlpA family protein disulfide reductase n=1 Tax=Aureivirga sp. CE67 TaxID=1788983 RepID=UPI00397916DD
MDFSTLNCGACVKSIPELKEIVKTYENKLNVFTFSADKNEKDWKKSIQRDSPTWLNLWDGKGSKSKTVIQNQVTAYPTFILIDENNQIVEKWSGYSDGKLKKKLNKYIQ